VKLGIGLIATCGPSGSSSATSRPRRSIPWMPSTCCGAATSSASTSSSTAQLPLAALSDAEMARFLAQAQMWEIELELGTRGLDTDT